MLPRGCMLNLLAAAGRQLLRRLIKCATQCNENQRVRCSCRSLCALPSAIWHLPLPNYATCRCSRPCSRPLSRPAICSLPLGSLLKNINSQGSSKVAGGTTRAVWHVWNACGMWRHVACAPSKPSYCVLCSFHIAHCSLALLIWFSHSPQSFGCPKPSLNPSRAAPRLHLLQFACWQSDSGFC